MAELLSLPDSPPPTFPSPPEIRFLEGHGYQRFLAFSPTEASILETVPLWKVDELTGCLDLLVLLLSYFVSGVLLGGFGVFLRRSREIKMGVERKRGHERGQEKYTLSPTMFL